MIRIKIEGKNIADLWSLACVRAITKLPTNNMEVKVRTKFGSCNRNIIGYAYIGDTIEVESEQSETCKIINKTDDIRAGLMQ